MKNRIILLWIVVIFLGCSLSATLVFARGGGKGHGGGGPHGWSQGEKEGWNSDVPPGTEKKEGDWQPSGLNQEKELQKENEKGEKHQEMEQERTRERKRHRKREQKGESGEK